MNVYYEVLFLVLLAAISFVFEFVFFRSYEPKDPGEMPAFIRREKGKATIGLLVGSGMLAYFSIKGTSVFGPLALMTFSIGAFAGAIHKERQKKRGESDHISNGNR